MEAKIKERPEKKYQNFLADVRKAVEDAATTRLHRSNRGQMKHKFSVKG